MVSINLRLSFRVGDSHVVVKMTKKEITLNQKYLYKNIKVTFFYESLEKPFQVLNNFFLKREHLRK